MPGRVESIIPQAPAGAARKRDYTWPDPYTALSGAATNTIRDRPGASNSASGGISGGTTGALNMGVINGVDCARLTNGVNVGGGPTISFDAARLRCNLLAANVKFNPFTDDYGAYRFYVIMRVVSTPLQATDCGMALLNTNNATNGIISGTGPGFGINYDLAGTLSFVIRQNNGANVAFQISPGGFLNTDFHMGEFRILSAQPGTNATIKTLLDGKLVDVRSWPTGGTAGGMPTPAGAGGNVNNGFIGNVKTNASNHELDVAVARIQFAPTEADLF